MITHIPKQRFHLEPNREVVFEDFPKSGRRITKVNTRIISLLEDAYINMNYVQVEDVRFLVAEMTDTRLGAENNTIRFKMETVEKV